MSFLLDLCLVIDNPHLPTTIRLHSNSNHPSSSNKRATMSTPPSSIPDFDDLPKVKDMPQGCAWGVFDRDGKKDVLGTINFLTPEIVQSSSSEIRDGVSISLKYASPPGA